MTIFAGLFLMAVIGRRLLKEAMHSVDQHAFAAAQLWTFKGVDAARRLYEPCGFELGRRPPHLE